MNEVLRLEGVAKTYAKDGPAPVTVLSALDLSVARGEVVALVAPSGAGKSTLLHIAGLLDTPGRDGWTPLGFAARSGNVAIAKALLNAGAARNPPCNASGKTPREIAAINAKSDGRAAALLQLLEVVQSR